jgi:hypothetical protein
MFPPANAVDWVGFVWDGGGLDTGPLLSVPPAAVTGLRWLGDSGTAGAAGFAPDVSSGPGVSLRIRSNKLIANP